MYEGFLSLIFLACLAELQNGIPERLMYEYASDLTRSKRQENQLQEL